MDRDEMLELEEEVVALRDALQVNVRRGLKIIVHEDWKKRVDSILRRVRGCRTARAESPSCSKT